MSIYNKPTKKNCPYNAENFCDSRCALYMLSTEDESLGACAHVVQAAANRQLARRRTVAAPKVSQSRG